MDYQKNQNKKLLGVLLLMIATFILFVFLLIKIYNFSEVYKTCEDDFRVIEECGCLPYEGNYSYFSEKHTGGMYDVERWIYHNGTNN